MDLKDLIELTKNNFNIPSILIPEIKMNGKTVENVEFNFMGFSKSPENWGKRIYSSRDLICRDSIYNMLYINNKWQFNKNIGECDVLKRMEKPIEEYVLKITGKPLQPYIRTYDGHTSSEKIFLPLECEVHGKIVFSADIRTLKRYPQWEGFMYDKTLKIKRLNAIRSNWWNANKAKHYGYFCSITENGNPDFCSSVCNAFGLPLSFCI